MSYVSEKQIKQIAQKINNDYAQKNGIYDDLVSGGSKQLLSNLKDNNQVPYIFRTAGGELEIGDRLDDAIVGGTICWNQLAILNTSDWSKNKASMSVSDTTITIAVVGTSTSAKYVQLKLPLSHKFLISFTRLSNSDTNGTFGIYKYNTGNEYSQRIYLPDRTEGDYAFSSIFYTDSEYNAFRFYFASTSAEGTALIVKDLQIIDLTKMYGSTIANYIYNLEQATEGAGVAWFRNLFPEEYYAYNTGTFVSVNTSAHKTVGFNAYNNVTGTAKLLGSMLYQITGTYTSLSYSTGEVIIPDSDGHFTPTNDGILTVVGGNDSDTCVHLSYDGEKDGEFEEYRENIYDLDKRLTLRGIPILNEADEEGNRSLYYDGDIYESDGTVTRRAVKVTLDGSESWATSSNPFGESQYFRLSVGAYGKVIANICISDKFSQAAVASTNTLKGINVINSLGGNNASIIIRPENIIDFTSLAQFKEWLAENPVTVIYLLSDSYATTETADPFTNPQIVDNFGTEEYINPRLAAPAFSTTDTYEIGDFVIYSDNCYRCITTITEAGEWDSTKWELDNLIVDIPVGHDTDYYPNLRAKLEVVPNAPDGEDGLYVVSHRSATGKNTYVPLPKELPAIPTEDGDYQLKVSIVNGQPTYSWEPPLTAEEIAEIISGLMGGNQ